MGGAELDGARPEAGPDVASLLPMLRRIVFSRVQNQAAAEDLVQETLVRVLAAANRIEPGMLEPYAIVDGAERGRARCGRSGTGTGATSTGSLELDDVDAPDERLLKDEERGGGLRGARAACPSGSEPTLLAHEVSGQDTKSLAAELGLDGRCGRGPAEPHPGAAAGGVPAGAARRRAADRPVSSGLVGAVRRRPSPPARGGRRSAPPRVRRLCARLSEPLLERRPAATTTRSGSRSSTTPTSCGRARAPASWPPRLGFSGTELTVIATAVSEISRNIVRFAERGEVHHGAAGRSRGPGSGSSPATPGRGSPTSSGRWPTATAPTAGWAWACRVRAG